VIADNDILPDIGAASDSGPGTDPRGAFNDSMSLHDGTPGNHYLRSDRRAFMHITGQSIPCIQQQLLEVFANPGQGVPDPRFFLTGPSSKQRGVVRLVKIKECRGGEHHCGSLA